MDWYYATQRSVITLPKMNQLMNSILYTRCSCLLKLPRSDLECQKLGRNRFLAQMTMVALESWLLHDDATVFFTLLRMILYAIHMQGSALTGINNLITFNMHMSSSTTSTVFKNIWLHNSTILYYHIISSYHAMDLHLHIKFHEICYHITSKTYHFRFYHFHMFML